MKPTSKSSQPAAAVPTRFSNDVDSAAPPKIESESQWPGMLRRMGIWLIFLVCWESAYRIIDWPSWKFPAPSHVIDATLNLLNIHTAFGDPLHAGWPKPQSPSPKTGSWYSGKLILANGHSFIRLLQGFICSISVGAIFGILMWRYTELNKLLGPLFLGLLTLPSVCWVPLGVPIFGLEENTIRFVMIMGSVFAVAISMRDGLRNLPPIYRRAGLMLGAKGWRLYRYVLFPASLPAFAASLRQGFSFSWRSLLGAELILDVGTHGLGNLLQIGREIGRVDQVIAVMIVMVVIGMLVDRWIFVPFQARINRRFGMA